MQTIKELENQFIQDVERIAKKFIQDYGLKHNEEVANLSDPLLRWLDFVTRYIQPVPRKIFVSSKFPKTLSIEAGNALKHLIKLIQIGADINPYQSKGLILHNDSSGSKKQKRTDLLWADWGIYHLHLTEAPIPSGAYFSNRSNWLLFCIVGSDYLYLIDVRNHDEPDLFSDHDLIKTVAESWPEFMERCRLNGILGGRTTFAPKEVTELRKAGITPSLNIDNQTYTGPGMGITSASTSSKVDITVNEIKKYIHGLAKVVYEPTNQFKTESAVSGIADPKYSIALTERGLAVHEEFEQKATVFPRVIDGGKNNFLAEFHDLFAPEWAVNFVMN